MSNETLPDDVALGAVFEEEALTKVTRTVNAFEQRDQNWNGRIVNGDIQFQNRNDLEDTKDFLSAVGGKFESFRIRNWADYQITTPESLGSYASGQTTVQLIKTISSGSLSWTKTIYKPRSNAAFKFYYDGVLKILNTHFTLNVNTGLVTFLINPSIADALTWEGEYDEQVRLDDDIYRVRVHIVFANDEKVESIEPLRLIGVRGE